MPTTDLDAIRARLAAATPGPWIVTETAYGKSVGHVTDDEDEQLFIESYGITYPHNPADADLIVYLRNNAVALVAIAEAARDVRRFERISGSSWQRSTALATARMRLDAALDALDAGGA